MADYEETPRDKRIQEVVQLVMGYGLFLFIGDYTPGKE